MDSIIDQMERLRLGEKDPLPPPPKIELKAIWKTLCGLHKENRKLKQYINYLISSGLRIERDNVPEWVY